YQCSPKACAGPGVNRDGPAHGSNSSTSSTSRLASRGTTNRTSSTFSPSFRLITHTPFVLYPLTCTSTQLRLPVKRRRWYDGLNEGEKFGRGSTGKDTAVNQAELRQMAQERVKDAKALLDGGRWEFAYYAAGYAVECALKSCLLARMIHTAWVFEEKWEAKACLTHEFGKLIDLAGLRDELNNKL